MARTVLTGASPGPGDQARPTRRRFLRLIETASNIEGIKEVLRLMADTQMEAANGLRQGGA